MARRRGEIKKEKRDAMKVREGGVHRPHLKECQWRKEIKIFAPRQLENYHQSEM
jgi:hypothetical protein